MPLDPRAKRFLDVLAATNPASTRDLSADERRRGLSELMRFSGPLEVVASVSALEVPGPGGNLRARLYEPNGAAAGLLPGLVYFHGGGLVAGDLETHDAVARGLANASGCRLLSVEYRLAPEHPFPAAIEDATAAVTHLSRNAASFGIDARRIGVAGDSAGATLAAVTTRHLSKSGDAAITAQLLLCPILDYAAASPSRVALGAGYLLDEATLEHDLAHYLRGNIDPRDPRVSPLREADLSGLPRTIIHTAEFDPLHDEGAAYAERLRSAGIPVSHTVHPGMIHLFYAMAGVIPYARTAIELAGMEIRAALS